MSRLRLLCALAALLAATPARAAEPFALNPGDHICIVGNTLAERMTHDGQLEAMLHARFPNHDLTIRNLGFSGDEITTRLRSMNFGTPDEWLSANSPCPSPEKLSPASKVNANRFANVGTRADVIFAFFGGNEAWAGPAGLPKFEADLSEWLTHTLSQKYNGESAPRVVLFSPIAHENLNSPDLPDGAEHNKLIALYTEAMRKVAAAKGVRFVDLFNLPLEQPQREGGKGQGPLTINGIHLNAAGNEHYAHVIVAELFGRKAQEQFDSSLLEAVREKNRLWFNRYRAVDGYSTFGERAFLKFTAGQTNYEVVQRELEVIDTMVANRDRAIWAAAKGQPAKVDDGNLPPFIDVATNKPGAGPGGKHLFLGGEEAIQSMKMGKDLKANLFADEAMFPELANPMQMQFDAKGRLWVAVWPTYPHWKPTEAMNDKLLILEDTDGDGKADKCTVFADGLHNPTGFEFVPGGILVAQCPDIVLLKDTDGDGKCDSRDRVLHGLDTADTHHAANSFVRGPAGEVYFQEGTFHHSQVESPYGPVRRNVNGGVYRYDPRRQKFDVYVTYGFANPHGHAFDAMGRDIVVDGTGSNPYDAALFSGHLPYPLKHNRTPQVYQQRTRPCGGIEYLSSSHFPEEFRDNLIVTNVIGFQGLLRYKVEEVGGTLKGTELEPILSSTDPNFRPVDVKTGPDGALYFVDWQNPIIGHMQHNLRDPSRDRVHGRVYRVTHEKGKAVKPVAVAGVKSADLVKVAAFDPDANVRSRARLELSSRPAGEVWAAMEPHLPQEFAKPDGRALAAALWLYQSFNLAANPPVAHHGPGSIARSDAYSQVADLMLENCFGTPYAPAAIRVLAEWRDRVPDALGKLRKLAADPRPRVRLEAVRAASFFDSPEALEVVLIARQQSKDTAVEFVAEETLKALQPVVQAALASGREIKFATPAGQAYLIQTLKLDALVKLPRTPAVATELLTRPGVRDDVRRDSVAVAATAGKVPRHAVVLSALRSLDREGADPAPAYDLVRLLLEPGADLKAARPELESLATSAKGTALRQLGFAALVAADASPEPAWKLAQVSPARLLDFVSAVPQLRDPNLKSACAPLLTSLLDRPAAPSKSVAGRFVRLELPGNMRTLTLAEVEVMSDGKNVALGKSARQSSTSHGGDAGRAVDGNKSGNYSANGQSHTREGEANPWWEVDLGGSYPIDAVRVYNRTDSNLNARLTNFTLRVLTGDRAESFARKNNASPDVVAEVSVGELNPERAARAQAMLSLAGIRGAERASFERLAKFLATPEREPAVRAMLAVPVGAWPKEVAPTAVPTLTAFLTTVPASEKTAPAALEAWQLASTLASLLPADQAKATRKQLGDLGVRVVRVGTLTDQMLYDQDRIVIQAGKPVEFAFANTDLMPHNFVITAMGKLEQVGNAAEAFGVLPGAQEKEFVPPGQPILLASKLLAPGQSQALRFQAPTRPGVYPYVCTYPGHWRRMHGALYVVADLDEYLANPVDYVARNPVPVADELLKQNRPRTEWTLAELAPALGELDAGGRSLADGKRVFATATCVGCHQYDGAGQNFGPNLCALDAKVFKTPADILTHILEPSLRIVDEYKTYTFNTADGKSVTGMVVKKTPGGDYEVVENPLARAETRLIRAADLDDAPRASATSMMPKGLLNTLTKDEILDLVAYIASKADAGHRYYKGGHGHTGGGHGDHSHAKPAEPWLVFAPGSPAGVGAGRRVVLVSGDEEYRSEESMPMLGELLAARHGFHCTVLFAIDPADGTVSPNVKTNIPGLSALDSADLLVLDVRMRNLPDEQMDRFAAYFAAGKPVVGLRTATHAFETTSPKYKAWNWTSKEPGAAGGFGAAVLGETWVAHHGAHGKQGTRGAVAPGAEAHPILRGIAPGSVFGPSDVYAVGDLKSRGATVLMLGEVTQSLDPKSPPAPGAKNAPMMPVAWLKPYTLGGKPGTAFTTTLGASQDFASEGTRRLVVNAALHLLGLEVPETLDVAPARPYSPTKFEFKKNEQWKPGKAPAELLGGAR